MTGPSQCLGGRAAGLLAFAAALLLPFAAAADGIVPGPVGATVVDVIDGDTIRVDAAIWPGITARVSVRVADVDTPELRGRCAAEKKMARRARDFTRKAAGETVILRNIRRGKYAGRVVATVTVAGGGDLGGMLIAAGLGRPYSGGRRRPWCR